MRPAVMCEGGVVSGLIYDYWVGSVRCPSAFCTPLLKYTTLRNDLSKLWILIVIPSPEVLLLGMLIFMELACVWFLLDKAMQVD